MFRDPKTRIGAVSTGSIDIDRAMLVSALLACGRQDRRAFRTVYELTSAKLYGICLRICGDRQAAEDVLQQVYLTVWQRAVSFNPSRASPITWLSAIARNRAIDRRRADGAAAGHRDARDWQSSSDELPDQTSPADEILIGQQDVRRMQDALCSIDELARNAIRDAFFGGWTYREPALRADIPLPTMKSAIRRALLRLRAELDDTGNGFFDATSTPASG